MHTIMHNVKYALSVNKQFRRSATINSRDSAHDYQLIFDT